MVSVLMLLVLFYAELFFRRSTSGKRDPIGLLEGGGFSPVEVTSE